MLVTLEEPVWIIRLSHGRSAHLAHSDESGKPRVKTLCGREIEETKPGTRKTRSLAGTECKECLRKVGPRAMRLSRQHNFGQLKTHFSIDGKIICGQSLASNISVNLGFVNCERCRELANK
jgi:hypothetical protein